MNFTDLGLSEEIVEGLKFDGIEAPTTIQEKAIPLALQGHDVIGMSRTGSGKTLAFSAPVLELLEPGKGIQALILTPTRELAVQIAKDLTKWSAHKMCSIATIYGGVGYDPQIKAMKKADIIVATPGRMLDHLRQGNVKLPVLGQFVLDEADKMVEMGFVEDVDEILKATPDSRQILLFGATISNEIEYLKKQYMKSPKVAEAEIKVKEDLLKQYYYNVAQHQKFSLLAHLLRKEEIDRAIIFCSKRSTVDVLEYNLRKQGFKVGMIHGKLSQNKRLKTIELLNAGKFSILIASAVAARGIHVDGVTHVFNYDLSADPQEYVHRVGRTARAGESGKAITLLSPSDFEAFGAILHRYNMNVEELPDEDFEKLPFQRNSQQSGGSRFGGRRGSSHPRHGRSGHSRNDRRQSSPRRSHGGSRSERRSDSSRTWKKPSNGWKSR